MGDSHGQAFAHQHSALVINDLYFEGGQALLEQATPICTPIARLRHYRARGYPVISANNNSGRWQVGFDEVIRHRRGDGARGARMSHELLPHERKYYILEPPFRFHQTPMSILLRSSSSERPG